MSKENECARYTRELFQLTGNQLIFLGSIMMQPESHGFNKGKLAWQTVFSSRRLQNLDT